nr:hypothetical protein [Tanacetum cinerariifolium]
MKTKPEKTPNVPLEVESPEPYTKQPFIEDLFVITAKIKILMEKFEIPPHSSPVVSIDPDDQPMWSNTMTIDPTSSSAIIQGPISTNFRVNAFYNMVKSRGSGYVEDFSFLVIWRI